MEKAKVLFIKNWKSKKKTGFPFVKKTKMRYVVCCIYNANNICIEQTTYDLTTNQRKKQIIITLDNNSLTTYTIKDITTTHYTYDHHNRIKQEEIMTKARNNIKVDYSYDNYQRINNISYNNKVKDNCIEQYTYDGTKIITYNSPYSETNR